MFFNKSKKLLQEKVIELDSALSNIDTTKKLLEEKDQELRGALSKIEKYEKEFREVLDKNELLKNKAILIKDAETKLHELNEKYLNGLAVHSSLQKEIVLYEDSLELGSYGLHKPRFSFDSSEAYKELLEINYERQKQMIRSGMAVICSTEWTVGGSKAEGKKLTNQYNKLMLFAFNGECDSLISKVKWNNASKARERIEKAYIAVNKLGVSQNSAITIEYLYLKHEELDLVYEYEQKKYEEKEEQRMIREQMREEEKAQREFEKAQRDAEDEERRYEKALAKAKQELQGTNGNIDLMTDKIKELESKLAEAQAKKARAIAQAQLTKVGHIYVISNVGSFGENVYKIGMTRRLDPHDRVRELGDASVPFHFDIHAIIYSENAPQLEFELHKKFQNRRLNRVNHRKEFFKISLDEIEDFIKHHTNAEIEFTKLAEAREYRETLTLIEQIEKLANELEIESHYPKSLIDI